MKTQPPARPSTRSFSRLCARLAAMTRQQAGSGRMLLMSWVLALWASPVMAQDDALRPPRTSEPPSGPKFLVIFIALILLACVVFAATLKTKRGHQD